MIHGIIAQASQRRENVDFRSLPGGTTYGTVTESGPNNVPTTQGHFPLVPYWYPNQNPEGPDTQRMSSCFQNSIMVWLLG